MDISVVPMNLTTLEGSPEEIGYEFDCSVNNLTDLQYGPKRVESHFTADNNKLTIIERLSRICRMVILIYQIMI